MPMFLCSPLAGAQLSVYLSDASTTPRRYPKLEVVYKELTKMAERLVQHEAPYLCEDVAPEVVSEMWTVLEQHRREDLERPPHERRVQFDPRRGTARAFFRLRLRNALKTVKASYAPAGCPTRDRGDNTTIDSFEASVPLESLTDKQLLYSATDLRVVEARMDAETLLAMEAPPVAQALYRAYALEEPVGEVVREAGMSRQQLNRAKHRVRSSS